MADDINVDELIEAPYKKAENNVKPVAKDKEKADGTEEDRRSKSKKRRRSKSRSGSPHVRNRSPRRRSPRRRSRSPRRRSRSPRRPRSRSPRRNRHRRSRSRSPDRHRRRSRSRDNDKHKERAGKRKSRSKTKSPPPSADRSVRAASPQLTSEERDQRTIFCMQLSGNTGRKDLEEVFKKIGELRDVRLIADRNSRRSKGIAYVEFREIDSVDKALLLNGTKVNGIPMMIQRSQAEKNRLAALQAQQKAQQGPTRLYVGSLHYNIDEGMMRAIFEPFGMVENVNIIRDGDTNISKGYGFIQFKDADSARRALDQLNGLEVAGRPIKVGTVTDRSADLSAMSALDDDDTERGGIEMNSMSRVALMAKLSATHNADLNPPTSAPALSTNVVAAGSSVPSVGLVPLVNAVQASPCFMISNMFDSSKESEPDWDLDIRDDIIDECNKYGNVVHVYVDKASKNGCVYVKCQAIDVAARAVKGLNGRWFAGNMITAQFISLTNYHQTFPQAANANAPLKSTST